MWLQDLLTALIPQRGTGLDTKKIDNNINKLLTSEWFKELYNNEKYRRLFITNRKIRSYLESKRRVKKLFNNSAKQEELKKLLDGEL